MDFTVSQELLVTDLKKLILLILIICSCGRVDNIKPQVGTIPSISIDAKDLALEKKGARIYLNDSLFSGYVVSHSAEGALQSKKGFLNGKLEGEAVEYYSNGQLRERRLYIQNRKTGMHLGFWPNGQAKFEYRFEADLHVGELKEWYATGQAYRFLNYVDGKENGSQKMWEPNGKIRANYVVKNGHRYGLIGLKNCKSVTDEEGSYTALAY